MSKLDIPQRFRRAFPISTIALRYYDNPVKGFYRQSHIDDYTGVLLRDLVDTRHLNIQKLIDLRKPLYDAGLIDHFFDEKDKMPIATVSYWAQKVPKIPLVIEFEFSGKNIAILVTKDDTGILSYRVFMTQDSKLLPVPLMPRIHEDRLDMTYATLNKFIVTSNLKFDNLVMDQFLSLIIAVSMSWYIYHNYREVKIAPRKDYGILAAQRLFKPGVDFDVLDIDVPSPIILRELKARAYSHGSVRGPIRWHEVMGHYVHDRKTTALFCHHAWYIETESTIEKCSICNGKRWFRRPHARGSLKYGAVVRDHVMIGAEPERSSHHARSVA